MKIEEKSDATIKSYVRAVERLIRFHDMMIHPSDLDIDEILDFLISLNEQDKVNNVSILCNAISGRNTRKIKKGHLIERQPLVKTSKSAFWVWLMRI